MLKNMVRGEFKTDIRYQLTFDDSNGCGFAFPCDIDGNIIPFTDGDPVSPAALENLEWCRQHPEKFTRAGEIVEIRQSYREPNRGTCACGQTVELYDQFYGACQCPECGRWYNLFGQELLPPDQWETDPSEEEYY